MVRISFLIFILISYSCQKSNEEIRNDALKYYVENKVEIIELINKIQSDTIVEFNIANDISFRTKKGEYTYPKSDSLKISYFSILSKLNLRGISNGRNYVRLIPVADVLNNDCHTLIISNEDLSNTSFTMIQDSLYIDYNTCNSLD